MVLQIRIMYILEFKKEYNTLHIGKKVLKKLMLLSTLG